MLSVFFVQLLLLLTLTLINVLEVQAQNHLFLSNEDAQRRLQRDLVNVFLIQLKPNHHHWQRPDFMMGQTKSYQLNPIKYNKEIGLYNNAENKRFINEFPQFVSDTYSRYYGKPFFLKYGNNFKQLHNFPSYQNNEYFGYQIPMKKIRPLKAPPYHNVVPDDRRSSVTNKADYYGDILRKKDEKKYYLPNRRAIIRNKSVPCILNQVPIASLPPIVKSYRSNILTKPCQVIYNTIRYDCCPQFQKFTPPIQKCPLMLTPATSNVTQNFLGFNALISAENGQKPLNTGNNNSFKMKLNESEQSASTLEVNQATKLTGNNFKKPLIIASTGDQSRRPFDTVINNAKTSFRKKV